MTTNILAPFAKVEESFQFYVNGRVFEMNETEIKEVEVSKNSTLNNAIRAFESFEFSNDSIKWFHGPSKFIYNLTEGKFQHNTMLIEGNTFSNHVLASGLVRYNEKATADLFESLPILLENFVSLDFAASFKGNGVNVELFKMNEEVYVSRFNNGNRISKFFKAKNANEALEYVKTETGESAHLFLKEMLSGEEKELAETKNLIESYESMISFLKDQKGLLASTDRNDAAIKEAENLINTEIKEWENKIAAANA
jgi:hypothetical protein